MCYDNNQIEPYGTVRAAFWNRHVYTTHVFETDVWYNWAFVYDKTQIRMYQNGAFLESLSLKGAVPNYTSGPVRLSSPSSQFFEGILDEVKIYNYALTAGQIAGDYNSYSGVTPTPNQSMQLTISNLKYTNNLDWGGTLDNWMKQATHTSLFMDVTISVEIFPSILVRNVQVRIDGTKNQIFTLTKNADGTFGCHLIESNPNNLKDFLWDWILAHTDVEVPGLPDFFQIEQPTITSVIVTDINGNLNEKAFNIDLPTAENLLPELDFSSTVAVFQCPIDAMITDSQNRRTGGLYEKGVLKETFSEIPSVYYFGEFGSDTMKFVVFPNSDTRYDIALYSFGTGSFEMNVLSFKNGIIMSQAPSESGTVTSGDIAKYTLSASEGGKTLNLISLSKNDNGIRIEAGYVALIIGATLLIAATIVFLKHRKTNRHVGQRRRLPPRDSS